MGLKWKRYGSFSGPVIYAKENVPVVSAAMPNDFFGRTLLLTMSVETGLGFGSINMADGTGITAGPLGFTAYLPRMGTAGPFFQLLERISCTSAYAESPFAKLIHDRGWYHSDSSGLVNLLGQKVDALDFREWAARSGNPVRTEDVDRSNLICEAAHALFSDERTAHAQTDFSLKAIYKFWLSLLDPTAQMLNAPPTMVSCSYAPSTDMVVAVLVALAVNRPNPVRRVVQEERTAVRDMGVTDMELAYVRALHRILGLVHNGEVGHAEKLQKRYQRIRESLVKLMKNPAVTLTGWSEETADRLQLDGFPLLPR